jgi:hypothetical protein
MIVDPGQLEMGSTVMNRLGDLGRHLDDPAADARFETLLTIPALRTFLAPRMAAFDWLDHLLTCATPATTALPPAVAQLMVTWLRSNDTGHWVLKDLRGPAATVKMAAFVSGAKSR